MYLPRHFEQNDRAALAALIREHPLATLVAQTSSGLTANHVPMLYDAEAGPQGTLRGHLARANPLWRELQPGSEALAIFHGPQAYVSPSWYASKPEHGKVVPTWNYAVVHAHGPLVVIDDAAWLRELVATLTRAHEAARTPPWHVDDAPADYIAQMVKAIVGFEIPVARLVGKWKASQNRPPADREGVVEGLRAEGRDAAIASAELVRSAGR
jgi:transcriptional regulator